MSERFIKFIPSEESEYLLENHPNAFLLLCQIATRARRFNGHIDGLQIGDAIIGDYEKAGLTRQKYRTALEKLKDLGFIKTIYNGKKFLEREKSTIKITIKGMLVNLCDSRIWDINPEDNNHQVNQRATNEQPTGNHEQERRKNEKEKEKINKKENAFLSDSIEIGLSNFFLSLILQRKPDFKTPNLQSWAKHIDAMLRIDKRDPDEIRKVMLWISQDSFESTAVLSTEKLRKRFDQLHLKSKAIAGKESRLEKNKQVAKAIVSKYALSTGLELNFLSESVEFTYKNHSAAFYIRYDEFGFESQLENRLLKSGCLKVTSPISNGLKSIRNGDTGVQNEEGSMMIAPSSKKLTYSS